MHDQTHHPLRDDETVLEGRWLESAHGPTSDAVEERIRWLVAHTLEVLGASEGGWDWLFRDPRDGRLWELTFPQGSLHGSGPRRLAVIAHEKAAEKYALRRSRNSEDQPPATS